MESSSCHSETVDISAISPIHEDDVIINVDGFVPSPPPLTLLPPMDVDADAVQGEKLLAIMEPCNDAVSLLQKHLSTMESENMAGGQAGISQCLTSFAVSHCRSTNDSGYIFEQFFMRCYEEVFQAHLAVVLDEVFTAMYTQMVAIPALKMITLHGRRIICMQRDLHIRSLIELFIMTSPKGGKAGRKQNRPHTPPKKNRRLVPWQSEIGRQRRSSRNYASEEAPDGRLNVNNKIGGSNSGGRGNGQNDTTVAGAQLSSPSPSLTRRLRTYEIVKPVARRRSPKKPPTDEELMDLERLACPNQR
ncbi:hypothetical protein DQ04_05521060 [Trypanosoma grayi]|uniref:hypothetical protein n=1 Tax=Trypanosoma grayi TaxID=71804 RepID=UPI0004F49851|nr:hypothetical protein DQ04_05521060 [Trypanosoma grayi]KEG09264.1 hypothetical protein DQ04_05521060 [Trypanosoma grayi]